MKNIKDLRDLEDLPIDSLSFKNNGKAQFMCTRRKRWRNRADHHDVNGKSIHKYLHIYLDRNLNKSFDEVFSKFCETHKDYQQKWFLSKFEPYGWDNEDYIIDENGLIQEKDPKWRRKRNLTYYSDDFEEKWRHKITKAVIGKERDGSPELYQRCTHKGCDHNNCSHKREDYELFTFKGWSKTFDKWNDPEFRKLRIKKWYSNKNKYSKKTKFIDFHEFIKTGEEKREKNLKSFAQQEEWRILREQNKLKREKKEYEDNLVKIISHGFDPINSFRHKLKS